MNEAATENGWVKLYHPSGALVTLPVTSPAPDYTELLDAVSKAVEAGWLVTAPGLEEGEQKFEAVAVCLRTKGNDDGTDTPIVDLYERDFEWKSLSVYLNREEDERAFEAASGLSLSKLTPFPAQAAPQRGASKQTDLYVVEAPRPFGVVCKPNPKFDPNETDAKKKKPKRLFVRWDGPKAAPPAGPAPTEAIGREAVIEILKLFQQCEKAGRPVNLQSFLKWIDAPEVSRIRRADYEKAVAELRRKLGQNGGAK